MKRIDFPGFYVLAYDDSLDARLSPSEEAAQVGTRGSDSAAAGGARKGAIPALEQLLVLLGPRFCPKAYGVAWFEPMRTAGVRIDRQKLPLQLLVAAEFDAHGHDRHRILAAVYHVDTEPVVPETVDPALRPDTQLDAGAIDLAPEVAQAQRGAEQRDAQGNGVHSAESARPVSDSQP